jgi:hypothetical protein
MGMQWEDEMMEIQATIQRDMGIFSGTPPKVSIG